LAVIITLSRYSMRDLATNRRGARVEMDIMTGTEKIQRIVNSKKTYINNITICTYDCCWN